MTTLVSDQELAAAVDELPPVSSVLQRLLAVLQDPHSDLEDIARLVRADTALSTKVLRLANSAHFGLPSRVDSIEEAVQQIGVNEVHRLVSILGSRELIMRPLNRYGIEAGLLWQHTLAVAIAAEVLADRLEADRPTAYVVGILHPIGFVALDRIANSRNLPVRPTDVPLLDWEREHFGCDNSGSAARVLQYWKFPKNLVEAVAARYTPPNPDNINQPASILHLACCLAERLGAGLPPEGGLFRFSTDRLTSYGLSSEQFCELVVEAVQNIARTRTLLQLA